MKIKSIIAAIGTAVLIVSAGCQDSPATVPAAAGVGINQTDQITIKARCVVSFFPDGAADYFSEQQHSIMPVSGDIRITAHEPEGMFRWNLVGGSYESSQPTGVSAAVPAAVIDRDVVLAIVTAFKASAGYFAAEPDQRQDRIRVNGKWYRPIEPAGLTVPSVGITLLQSSDDGSIDFVRIHNDTNGAVTTAHAYNASRLEEADTFVPTRIDIFRRTSPADKQQKILQVHYVSFSAE